jgi:hypothetical protein
MSPKIVSLNDEARIRLVFICDQGTGNLHDRHKAGAAREGIRDEIAMNIAVLESRSAAQPCVDRRLDDIAALLEASEGSKNVEPLS